MNIIKKRDKKLASVISDIVQNNSLLSNGLAEVSIEAIYKKKMGKTVSAYTSQIYLKSGKLFIYIDSAPLRAELSMSRLQLKDLLNEELGTEIIKEIIFK
jgi:hypothetical protein